ncbi:MAG: hypothetical protein ACK4MS_15585 [Paracoccaceae bacterium]
MTPASLMFPTQLASSARVLISIDILFILTALLCGFAVWMGWLDQMPRRLGLEYDHSLGNIWNYLKWVVIAGLFARLWWQGRAPVHAAAALVFAGVFFDDALELHEAVGARVASLMQGPTVHHAESMLLIILALGAWGLVTLAWRGSSPSARRDMSGILVLTGLLIVLGGSLDLLQSEVRDWVPATAGRILGFGIGLLEDGTELILASLILASTLALRGKGWQIYEK